MGEGGMQKEREGEGDREGGMEGEGERQGVCMYVFICPKKD